MLGGSLGTPYYASAGSTGVEAGMGAMSFVGIAELAVDLGIQFATDRWVNRLRDGSWQRWQRDISCQILQVRKVSNDCQIVAVVVVVVIVVVGERNKKAKYLALGPLLTENLRAEVDILNK